MPGRISDVSEGDRPSAARQNAIGQALQQHDTPSNAIVDDLGIATRPTAGGGTSPLRMVKVVKDGGVAGSASTNCTWTYTISTLSDVELETGLTPHRSRYANTIYTQAPDDSYGQAVKIDGNWVLLVAWQEIEQTSTC